MHVYIYMYYILYTYNIYIYCILYIYIYIVYCILIVSISIYYIHDANVHNTWSFIGIIESFAGSCHQEHLFGGPGMIEI
jgi:hypothetical protein